MIRELLDDDGFGTPDKQSRAAAQRLTLDIKQAPDMLIGRLLAGCRGAKFWKKWDMHRSLVAGGRQKDGMDALDAVASACEPEL